MAYVALSRARILIRVFLIDFSINSLYCCKPAFEEYKRLYKRFLIKSGFPIKCNVLPIIENTSLSFTSVNVSKTTILNESMASNRIAPLQITVKDKVSKSSLTITKKKNIIISTLDSDADDIMANQSSKQLILGYPLRLNNNNNHCYCNVSIQALMRLQPDFTNEIVSLDDNELNDYTKVFKKIYLNFYSALSKRNVTLYSTEFQVCVNQFSNPNCENYIDGLQHDGYLFFIDLLARLNLQIQKLFHINIINDVRCQVCECHNTYNEKNQFSINITLCQNSRLSDIDELFSLKNTSERHCSYCTKITKHSDVSSLLFDSKNKYVIVNVNAFINQDNVFVKVNSKLNNLDKEVFNINNVDNYQFKLIAIIIRTGNDTESGHYKIWTSSFDQTSWYLINDAQSRSYKKIYQSLDNVRFLILERLINT